jgi:hypothetical protein
MFQQFSCMNFHKRCYQGVGAKLTPPIKNKWSSGWTRVWFYCKVSAHVCAQGGKVVHILHSYLCGLDFQTCPPFDCADEDSRDVAFIRATNFIGGRDAVEEKLACRMYPMSASVGFERVANGVTPVSSFVPCARMMRMMFNFWRGLNWRQRELWVVTLIQSMTFAWQAYPTEVG